MHCRSQAGDQLARAKVLKVAVEQPRRRRFGGGGGCTSYSGYREAKGVPWCSSDLGVDPPCIKSFRVTPPPPGGGKQGGGGEGQAVPS